MLGAKVDFFFVLLAPAAPFLGTVLGLFDPKSAPCMVFYF